MTLRIPGKWGKAEKRQKGGRHDGHSAEREGKASPPKKRIAYFGRTDMARVLTGGGGGSGNLTKEGGGKTDSQRTQSLPPWGRGVASCEKEGRLSSLEK